MVVHTGVAVEQRTASGPTLRSILIAAAAVQLQRLVCGELRAAATSKAASSSAPHTTGDGGEAAAQEAAVDFMPWKAVDSVLVDAKRTHVREWHDCWQDTLRLAEVCCALKRYIRGWVITSGMSCCHLLVRPQATSTE